MLKLPARTSLEGGFDRRLPCSKFPGFARWALSSSNACSCASRSGASRSGASRSSIDTDVGKTQHALRSPSVKYLKYMDGRSYLGAHQL
jgi:hypothetical protein